MARLSTKHLIFAVIFLICIVGGAIALYASANGPWGYTDPVAYISSARSLDHGQGLGYYEGSAKFTLLTYYPPFYPLVLSLFGLTGVSLIAIARWFNIFAFSASIFISGFIFHRFNRTRATGIVVSALMCAFPVMVMMFSSAYSEPLFILSFLSGGLCLLVYLNKDSTAKTTGQNSSKLDPPQSAESLI